MAGKLCFGEKLNNAGAGHIRSSKAFCEGLSYRAQGTAIQFPKANNPHVADSEASDAWDLGWGVTEAAAGGQVSKADAPCCSIPQGTISA